MQNTLKVFLTLCLTRREVIVIEEDVTFCATIKWETEAALLLSDGVSEFWVPKSQVIEQTQIADGDYDFVVPEWLAIEKGIV